MQSIKTKFKLIFALAAVFLAAFLGGIFTLPSFKANAATGDYNKYPANSKVGYYAEYLGTVERQKPEEKTAGFATKFPTYGTTLYGEGTSEGKQALRQENEQLISEGLNKITGCYFDSIDKEGNLYLKGEQIGRELYKHKAAKDMYYGNVSDDEEAIVKKISYQSHTYGNHITGLYAPAGEVLTLTIDKSDFDACGGLTVYMGQSFSDGSANVIASNRAYNRMPYIVSAMNLTDGIATLEYNEEEGTVTGYFGSFLGGPVYLKPVNGGSAFTVTISGGVRYSHFILGYTTEQEFNLNAKSSAPYFDLEVWDRGVRHSGPKKYAEKYSYSQLYNVAVLWEKFASLSNQFPSKANSGCGIDFLYDPFVTTQNVPQNTVNCLDTWLNAALDYDSIVKNGYDEILGTYNSRFTSGWGLTKDSVSNDAITLIAYSLFTDISSKRNLSNENEGLDGLSAYSSASLSLRRLKGEREDDLAVHATILHSFGQDLFIQAVGEDSRYTQSTDRWFRSLVTVTKRDMTYYFTKLCGLEISEETLAWAAEKNYPMFVPASCIYQTGEVYELNGENISFETMQPYAIEYDEPFEINFDRVLELPYGFGYKIKSVTSPENGSIQKSNSHTYIYTPEGSQRESGKIYVRIGIAKDDNGFEVEDKILVLEFKLKQTKPRTLQRTTYTYSEGNAYTSAKEAYSGNYEGYKSVANSDNLNTSGEYGTADIAPGDYAQNTVIEVIGKYFVPSDGEYRIAVRGRGSGALYLSSNGKEYHLLAEFEGNKNTEFSNNEDTYADLTLEIGSWLYFKEILCVKDANSFMCLGIGKYDGDSVTVESLSGAYRNNYFADPEQTFVSEHRYKNLNNTETINNISGFIRLSPDDGILNFSADWTVKQAQSTFGHIYEGGQSSALEFTFYGTRFAIYSNFAESYGEYEIYVDGNKTPVKTVSLGSKSEISALAYVSDSLSAGTHTVKISGKSGTFNIDSISLRTRTDPSTSFELPDLTPDADSEKEDFRKPSDHPTGDGTGNGGGHGTSGGGQNTPNGKDYTGLIVGLSVGGVLLIAVVAAVIIILRKKHNH